MKRIKEKAGQLLEAQMEILLETFQSTQKKD